MKNSCLTPVYFSLWYQRAMALARAWLSWVKKTCLANCWGAQGALVMADPRDADPAQQHQHSNSVLGTSLDAPMLWKWNMIIIHASATRLLLSCLTKMKVVFSVSKPVIFKVRNWQKQKSTGPPSLINCFSPLRRDNIFLSSQGICKSKRCYYSLGPNGWEW